jgi:hypothetical protein
LSYDTNYVNYSLQVTNGDGAVVLGADGRLNILIYFDIKCNEQPVTIQPYWYGSYELDRKFGNVDFLPILNLTLPSQNAPEFKHWHPISDKIGHNSFVFRRI